MRKKKARRVALEGGGSEVRKGERVKDRLVPLVNILADDVTPECKCDSLKIINSILDSVSDLEVYISKNLDIKKYIQTYTYKHSHPFLLLIPPLLPFFSQERFRLRLELGPQSSLNSLLAALPEDPPSCSAERNYFEAEKMQVFCFCVVLFCFVLRCLNQLLIFFFILFYIGLSRHV